MTALTSLQLPPRLHSLALAGVLVVFTLCIFLFSWSTPAPNGPINSSASSSAAALSQFHLLVPATPANLNLCRLLLSSAITGYPEPILLGWNGHGMYDGAQSQLFKISETLAYLNRLPLSADDDLVLVLDGYDIVMQLRPDVLISRYIDLAENANARLAADGVLGKTHGGSDIRQTIFFGPDKACWPDDDKRAACWAVPESTMDNLAFGPNTDHQMVQKRPRWLNSGTIIGPAKDMRDMFQGVMALLNRTYNEEYEFKNSDQLYFQDVWGEQEFGRLLLSNATVEAPLIGDDWGYIPDFSDGRRTEFHIALDYESSLFQTSAAYAEFCTWMRFNHSSSASIPLVKQNVQDDNTLQPQPYLRLDQLTLPNDVIASPPPIPHTALPSTSLPANREWKDMLLGINAVTQQPFPIFHMTCEKAFRDRWWPCWWFHPHGEALLTLSQSDEHLRKLGDDVLVAEVRGTRYIGAKMRDDMLVKEGVKVRGEVNRKGKGGVWTDLGEWLEWDAVCGEHEPELFLRTG